MGVSQARAGAALLRLWSSTDAISTGHHNKKRHTPPHTHSLIWAAFRPHFSRHALCTLYGFNSARRQHTEHSHTAPVLRAMAASQRLLSCNPAQSQPSARPSAHRRAPAASRVARAPDRRRRHCVPAADLAAFPHKLALGDCRGVEAPPSVSYRRSAGAAAGGRHRQRRWRPRRRLAWRWIEYCGRDAGVRIVRPAGTTAARPPPLRRSTGAIGAEAAPALEAPPVPPAAAKHAMARQDHEERVAALSASTGAPSDAPLACVRLC